MRWEKKRIGSREWKGEGAVGIRCVAVSFPSLDWFEFYKEILMSLVLAAVRILFLRGWK